MGSQLSAPIERDLKLSLRRTDRSGSTMEWAWKTCQGGMGICCKVEDVRGWSEGACEGRV